MSAEAARQLITTRWRKALFCALYGMLAGMAAAGVLWLMNGVSHALWSRVQSPWGIFVVIMIGGALIAVLRHFHAGEDLAAQLQGAPPARQALARTQRNALLLAAMAIIAVGFGGAVGPEAGILAVMAELSVLMSLLLARSEEEARLVAEVGAAGALGGLYGSPPGGAMVAQMQTHLLRWELLLAGLCGLFGFALTASHIMPGQPLHIALPAHVPAADGSDLLAAVLPALLGAAMGVAFVHLFIRIQAGLQRLRSVSVQTLVGSAFFAALAAWQPILRFSGHHEMGAMLAWGQSSGMALLLALALLKVLALALCLNAGWRGGSAFSLLFAGAAAGGAVLYLMPSVPPTVALVAGMTAALVTGMGKPRAALGIALLMLAPHGVGPLCVGAAIGWAASRLVPQARLH